MGTDRFIPDKTIQQEAEGLIRAHQRQYPDYDLPYDLEKLIWDSLNEVDGLSYDDTISLGSEGGEKVLGKTVLEDRIILIDPSIKGKAIFPFTLAHEIGHWILHCRPHLCPDGQTSLFGESDFTQDQIRFTTFNRDLTPKTRIPVEIQANKFASNLLMPERELVSAFEERFGKPQTLDENTHTDLFDFGCDLSKRRVGHEDPLWKVFGVSASALAYRLIDLNIIYESRGFLT